MSDDRYDTNIVPLGRKGAAGRGRGSATPSSAARSLAGGASAKSGRSTPQKPDAPEAPKKPVKVKATAGDASGATKAAAQKPASRPSGDKKSAAKKSAAKKSAPKRPARSSASDGAARPATETSGRSEDPGRSADGGSGRRPHLRVAPDPGAEGGEPRANQVPPEAEEHIEGGLPLEDIMTALVEGAQRVLGEDWEARLMRLLAQVRHRISGDYAVDEFGFDEEIAKIAVAAAEPLIENWFRLEVRGIENIPESGGALLVANHSGTVPLDGVVTGYVIRKYAERNLRPLGADLVFQLPFVGQVARKIGATLACAEDAERLLTSGELAAVWPEGFKGIGKPYSERYKLQRFGRGGFVSSAMRAQVPIVPVSIVGAEEIYPLVGNVPSLARLLGIPYLPITPFFPALGPLGLIPLPSKWIVEFGEPIRTDAYEPDAADDPMLLFEVTDQVRETIQQTLYKLLIDRGNPFL